MTTSVNLTVDWKTCLACENVGNFLTKSNIAETDLTRWFELGQTGCALKVTWKNTRLTLTDNRIWIAQGTDMKISSENNKGPVENDC